MSMFGGFEADDGFSLGALTHCKTVVTFLVIFIIVFVILWTQNPSFVQVTDMKSNNYGAVSWMKVAVWSLIIAVLLAILARFFIKF